VTICLRKKKRGFAVGEVQRDRRCFYFVSWLVQLALFSSLSRAFRLLSGCDASSSVQQSAHPRAGIALVLVLVLLVLCFVLQHVPLSE